MMSTGFVAAQVKGVPQQRQTYLPSAIGTSSEFKKGLQRNPSAGRLSQQSTNPPEQRAPIHIESGSYQPTASMKPARAAPFSVYGLQEMDDLYSQYSVPSPKMSKKEVP